MLKVAFKIFKSEFKSWAELCQEAADFLTEQGPERTIGVSHSQQGSTGVVIAWYWSIENVPAQPVEY